ncbi:MAG: hypothetical protein KJ941_03560 [Bacteroidetes bacterium]|nr:hypothetical protein [Bacteroidota bacterium]
MDNKSIGFSLIGLKTEQFATFSENFNENETTSLDTTLDFKISDTGNHLILFSTFAFEQNDKVIVKIQISTHFNIKQEAWDSFKNGEEIVFPKGFLSHIAMLSVGSARGVLHAKTEGTIFNQFLLPTINVAELIEKDVAFQLK